MDLMFKMAPAFVERPVGRCVSVDFMAGSEATPSSKRVHNMKIVPLTTGHLIEGSKLPLLDYPSTIFTVNVLDVAKY
ncbi:hypothetical protein NECAME_08143 [Necator americanus]|uniref:Uncharacterized protein n=1 Tax=Necator americanus TaxID=51031 RepID=W2TM90_NECAM|nr:hypothetical protein NECAME_08143 [Necator americanus]ETN82152.1 hypothetical protein NECAME_08143 [Necator americanus]